MSTFIDKIRRWLFGIEKEFKKNKIEDYWNFKREPKNILYTGRHLPFTKKRIAVPVQLFITPNDPKIKDYLKYNKLIVEEDDNKKLDKHIMKVYKFTRIKPSNPYKYVHDIKNAGVREFWYFPFEMRELGSDDCEGYAVELASYLIASGVPRFRVRCVAGLCRRGEGHATVYVLGDDLKTWKHLNSTSPYWMIKDKKSIKELPKANDKNDEMGIEHIWFSWNDKYSWSEFETELSEETFNKFLKQVKIDD